MAIKEIIWSELAITEFRNVLDYYVQNNGSATYSNKLVREVEKLLTLISQNELIGRLTGNKFTRAIPLKHYIIFYEINYNTIEIISFWDSRQNPRKLKVE